ncbi:uncharacterized protein LOC117513931 [Thalassophryne amazonica]|uniref:uncharacterized protein LOC117513931 n=1 Tax=Thalassophryne amazonica TaxID=390379 RepID=UPI0014710878|nr:uncharacterized protein LOC117513931 [Thalassophryne amazonica]
MVQSRKCKILGEFCTMSGTSKVELVKQPPLVGNSTEFLSASEGKLSKEKIHSMRKKRLQKPSSSSTKENQPPPKETNKKQESHSDDTPALVRSHPIQKKRSRKQLFGPSESDSDEQPEKVFIMDITKNPEGQQANSTTAILPSTSDAEITKFQEKVEMFNEKWPIFKVDDPLFFKNLEKLAEVLLEPRDDQVCQTVPIGCDKNMSFLVDVSKNNFLQNNTCDETGKYNKPSYTKKTVRGGQFTLIRKSARHKDTPDVQRIIYHLVNKSGETQKIVAVCYQWTGKKGDTARKEPHSSSVQPVLTEVGPPRDIYGNKNKPVGNGDQPFTVCSKNRCNAKVCYGCGRKFVASSDRPPNDLLLKHFDYREWTDKDTKQMMKSKTLQATYFHLNIDCVRRRYPQTEIKDITVYNEVKDQLSPLHIRKLQSFGITLK